MALQVQMAHKARKATQARMGPTVRKVSRAFRVSRGQMAPLEPQGLMAQMA